MNVNTLSIWCIYDHPIDMPDHYVARRFAVMEKHTEATTDVLSATHLETLREIFRARGLFVMPRFENDAPKIIETWL